MAPLPPTNTAVLGRIAAELLFDNERWIHRRKDTVKILDDTWFRRQISIDYELPDTLPSHRQGPGGKLLYAVPITLMRKSPPAYVNFDMRDQSNAAMSLMTRVQNAAVSCEALRWAAKQAAFGQAQAQLPPNIDGLLRRIAEEDPVTASFAIRAIREQANDPIRDSLIADDRFMWLALAFAEHSVVMVEVPAGDGRRRIIKLSYDERNLNRTDEVTDEQGAREARGGLRPYQVFIDSPFIAAGTYHFELVAPAGLQVMDTTMREYFFLDALSERHLRTAHTRPAADPEHERTSALVRRGTRTHLYVADAGVTDRAEVDVSLRVQREGFVSTAAWVATAIAALLVFFLIWLGPVIEHQGVIPSLLLIAPGIIAAVVGRAGDHQLTIRMLNLARRAMLVSAACVLIAAVALALSRTGHGHEPTTLLWIVWGAVTVIAAYCALLLQFARLLPRRHATSLDEKLIQLVRPLTFLLDASFPKSS